MRRFLTGSLVTLTAALVFNVAAANAADLLELNGDPAVTLSGTVSYGIVYVDGDLQLTGDTTIDAASIYFGPDARIDTCYVAGAGDKCIGGRSLTLNSSGPLTVVPNIDLESGGSNASGGSLSLTGTSVAVGGQIDTSGDTGYPSGTVTINSRGAVATQGILAPGAVVSINGHGATLIGNSIQTQGSKSPTPTGNPSVQLQAGGPVTINANGGEVDIDGAITSQGQGAPGTGGGGGAGGPVTIAGANVHTESITTYGGGSSETGSGPGLSSPISITASGTLSSGGTLDTSGTSGAGNSGAPGAPITLKASGAVALGSVDASGGPASVGAPISISGTSVTAGDVNTSGGGGNTAVRSGANAAGISIVAPQGAVLGSLLAVGGNSNGSQTAPSLPGAGAPITVSSSAGSISAGRVEAEGGGQGTGPGNSGGSISLKAADDLTVAGHVRVDGSNAGGSSNPGLRGGNAGNLYLAASTGTMNIGGPASAQGGAGSNNSVNNQLGGAGGTGGQITLIAHELGLLASLSAQGGAGGGYDRSQGPGGQGGSLAVYTDAEIFNSQRLVSADGGDGNPTGVAGKELQEASPTALTAGNSGAIRFKSNSAGATQYELEVVKKGGKTKIVARSKTAADLLPDTQICQKVKLEAIAIISSPAWTSDASNLIDYERPPSKRQTCAEPAKLTLPKQLASTVNQARQAHWVQALRFGTAGVGTLKATLTYTSSAGQSASVTAKVVIRKKGTKVLHLQIPSATRAAGSGTLTLTDTSPDGRHHKTMTVAVRVSA